MLSVKSKSRQLYWIVLFFLWLPRIQAQEAPPADSTLQTATLEKVVQYTLAHQPAVQQAQIDEEVTNKLIKGKLADWYPQINFAYNYQRILEKQKAVFNGGILELGAFNTSFAQVNATQNIFNRDVLLASRTASTVRLQAGQNTERSKIDAVVNVSKAFYDLLATSQQIKVSKESIVRLERSLKDAQSRYTAGVTDKSDYKRAMILLGNAKAALKSNTEILKFKEEYLKSLMGYPVQSELPIEYDTLQMENEIIIDTLEQINYAEHIDYKLLYTQKELQNANVKYNYWAFLPTLSATAAYTVNYQNDSFGNLFSATYPFSYVGATFAVPIFQGGKRTAKIKEQKWVSRRLDWSMTNLKNNLNTEYTRALSAYKSSLAIYLTQKENVELAREVYDIIQLQYKNGVKAYLDVTIAETDLRTTRINYFNALYSVLASKMDVQRALGQINY